MANEPPLKDPDSLPTSTDPSGPCPRCGRTSNFDVVGSVPVTCDGTGYAMTAGGTMPSHDEQVTILSCHGCGQRTVVIEEEWVGLRRRRDGRNAGGVITWQGIHWWPAPGAADLDPSIPLLVRDAFAEGQRALSARAPRAASVMFRRTLEAVVEDLGSDAAKTAAERNLAAALQAMVEEGALLADLAHWAKEIRLVGNAGAHLDAADPVEQQEAEDLSRLLRALLNYFYEVPATLRRSRGVTGSA